MPITEISADQKEDFWTAGKESKCPGKFEWCSNRIFFSLSQKVSWDNVSPAAGTKRCVSGNLGNKRLKMSAAECQEKKTIICEVLITNSNKYCLSVFYYLNSLQKEQKIRAKKLSRSAKF